MRQVCGHLLVKHVLIKVLLITAHQAVFGRRGTHALEQHAGEQALELARSLAHRLTALSAHVFTQRTKTLRVGVELAVDGSGAHV